MSLASDRTELVDLLNTVDGIQGFEYRPKTMNVGDAWPFVERLERGPARNFEVTWSVLIILPSKEYAYGEWFADHYEDIAEALEDFGYVELIEPDLLSTEAGPKNVMILTLNKEA